MSSCDRSDYYGFHYPPCSNNGICISSDCYCNKGWTSIGDYELNPHFDCDININAIRILCIITLFIFLINLSIIFNALSRIKFTIYHIFYDAKLTVYLCFLLDIIGHSISAVSKSINPVKYVIGASNGIVNIGNNIFIFFCVLGWCYYYQIFTLFIQGYSKMIDKESKDKIIQNSIIVDNYLIYSLVFPVISIICDDLIFLYPNKSDMFAIGNLLGLLFATSSLVIASELSLSIFINEIGKYLSNNNNNNNEQITYIYKNVKSMRLLIALFFTFAIITCGIFAIWSFLRRKITYLHQCLHIFIAIIEGSLCYLLTPKSTYTATFRNKSTISISLYKIINDKLVNHVKYKYVTTTTTSGKVIPIDV